MPQLDKFRKGWENEHLATFLLSRVAFVASPVKIGDDIGTDLFCTLFEVDTGQLLPRNSFAIQIKSSSDEIDAGGKIGYLEKLELPFLIGAVDQGNLRLSIYSGEYLPVFFSHHGIPSVLKLSLETTEVTYENYFVTKSAGAFKLKMPHVLDLEAKEDPVSIAAKTGQLLKLCSRMLQNVSSRISREYVFKLGDGRAAVFAGPGSAITFRDNFYYRLAEAFYNFEWLYLNDRTKFNIGEYHAFESFYRELKGAGQLPLFLQAAYEATSRHLASGLTPVS